jgi:hypothetical protein
MGWLLIFPLESYVIETQFFFIYGCVYPRYIYSHVLHCIILLYIFNSPQFFTFVRKMYVHMISLTTQTLHWLLPCSFLHFLCHFGLFGIWLSLKIISEYWWLGPLLPLLHLSFFLFFPSLLVSGSSSILIIETLGSPYILLQCLGIIILYFVTDK